MEEKLTSEQLEELDNAISEMNRIEDDKKTIAIEKGLEDLLKQRNDIDNIILRYQFENNMSGPFNIEILKGTVKKGYISPLEEDDKSPKVIQKYVSSIIKLKALVKSRNEVFPVDKVSYGADGNIIGYSINGYWYRKDEKRRGWGSMDDIEIIF